MGNGCADLNPSYFLWLHRYRGDRIKCWGRWPRNHHTQEELYRKAPWDRIIGLTIVLSHLGLSRKEMMVVQNRVRAEEVVRMG